ncbi:MAG TPA: hypothetical protein VF175_16220 [Lacipirellula sp.]
MYRPFTLALLLAFAPLARAAEILPLLYEDDFEDGMDRWQTMDPDPSKLSFKVVELEGPEGKRTNVFRALGTSAYQPKHRSPPNFALLKDITVGDFELTAKVQSTNSGAGAHRDMCILWGYQDPAHFYYVHFGAKADPHACQIFIVNDAPRIAITQKQAKGTPWTNGWHEVKVVRRVGDGTIEVYFDDMDEPFMAAHDNTFAWGRVGLGTFDDNGNWDDFKLHGTFVDPKAAKEQAKSETKVGAEADK